MRAGREQLEVPQKELDCIEKKSVQWETTKDSKQEVA